MRHLRAAFVLFHVVAITVMSIPAPVGGMNEAEWSTSAGKREIHRWGEAVRGVGLDVSDQALRDFVWNAGNAWLSFRNDAVAPFRPYLVYTGSRQSWRMFSMVAHEQGRLAISLDRGNGPEPLFVTYEHEAWRRRELRQERTRTILGDFYGRKSKRVWPGFVDRLADWAREDFPDGRTLEVEIATRETPAPGAEPESFAVAWKTKRALR
jgi:hypothetical protein